MANKKNKSPAKQATPAQPADKQSDPPPDNENATNQPQDDNSTPSAASEATTNVNGTTSPSVAAAAADGNAVPEVSAEPALLANGDVNTESAAQAEVSDAPAVDAAAPVTIEELHEKLHASKDFDERRNIRNQIRELRKPTYEAKVAELQAKDPYIDLKRKQAALEQQLVAERIAQQSDSDHVVVSTETSNDGNSQIVQTTSVDKSPDGKTVITKQTNAASKAAANNPKEISTDVKHSNNAEQMANTIADQMDKKSKLGTSGKVQVKTESWSSKDGQVKRTEKTAEFGEKKAPVGKSGGIMNKFKQMDKGAPKAK